MDQTTSVVPLTLNNNHILCNAIENMSECLMNNSSMHNVLLYSSNKETYLERSFGFLIIGIIGILANAFVIIILGTSVKIRRKLVNTLIIHQSFVDFLASIALVGTAHLSAGDQHGLEGVHADIYCFFIMGKWPLWFMMLTSSFSLMFINIERYISIVYPIFHHTKVTRKKVIMLLPIVWILGLLEECLVASSFVSVDGACGVGPTSYHTKANSITLGYSFISLHFFVPVILVIILYGHMIIRLRKSVKSKHDVGSEKRDDIMEKAKKNIFKTMLLITICYAICYAFNCIYIVVFLLGLVTLTGR